MVANGREAGRSGRRRYEEATPASPLRDREDRATPDGIEHWYRVGGAQRRTVPLLVVHGVRDSARIEV